MARVRRRKWKEDAGAGHLWRVAAWCAEIAQKRQLGDVPRAALDRAAMLHQSSKTPENQTPWETLCADLGIPAGPTQESDALALEILKSFHGDDSGAEGIGELVAILEASDNLDHSCECDAQLSGDPEVNGLNGAVAIVSVYLQGVTSEALEGAFDRMPVFPSVAAKAYQVLGDEEAVVRELEQLIGADQTLAGNIIKAANAASLNGPEVNTIRKALMRIGTARARQVVGAIALRPVFATPHCHAQWNHSIAAAVTAAELAARVHADTDEAFLAGLVHDIGKLLFLGVPSETRERHERLLDKGCPDGVVERTVFGTDHAALGAEVLRQWRFPESVVSGVKHHHQPERNSAKLSSILYLTEKALRRDEGLPSEWRDQLAGRTLGVQGEFKACLEDAVLATLRFAA